MLDKFSYENSKGNIIEFGKPPYFADENDLRDFEWDYESKNKTGILSFSKEAKPKKLTVKILNNKNIRAQINELFETFEVDVINNSPGKLLIGDHYLEGFFFSSTKKKYTISERFIVIDLEYIPTKNSWCKDILTEYRSDGTTSETYDYEFLDFPHVYLFDFAPNLSGQYLINNHIGACEFEMRIYGPVTDPVIDVNGTEYAVKSVVYMDEFLVINSKDKTVLKYKPDGSIVNEFNGRVDDVFQPIPPGKLLVDKGAVFSLDIILYEERSEPLWNLY